MTCVRCLGRDNGRPLCERCEGEIEAEQKARELHDDVPYQWDCGDAVDGVGSVDADADPGL
jgi:hypothetical protein